MKAAGVDPLTHFDQSGWKEGRAPSIDFDPAAYLAANPDVKTAERRSAAALPRSSAPRRPPAGRVQPICSRRTALTTSTTSEQSRRGGRSRRSAAALPGVRLEGRPQSERAVRCERLSDHLRGREGGGRQSARPLQPVRLARRSRSVSRISTTRARRHYPDIAAAQVNPLNHILVFGLAEGRSAFPDYLWG